MYVEQVKIFTTILSGKVIELTLIILVALGIFGKLYSATLAESNFGAGAPFMLSFLFARDGAIAGSNYISQLIFTLLPLTSNKKIGILCTVFLMTYFSRGVTLCLCLYWIWQLAISHNRIKALKELTTALLAMFLIVVSFQSDVADGIFEFATERLLSHQDTDLETRYENESRFELFADSLRLADESNYLGVGPGGFYYSQISLLRRDADSFASNAHNLYLTILAEGGAIYLLGNILLYIFILITAVKQRNSKALLSMTLLLVYFAFSGEYYEATRYTTVGPYYFFIFLLAYIKFTGSMHVKSCKKDTHLQHI